MQIMPFVSWDQVHTGACQWTDAGRCVSCDPPRGVELRVEPAAKSPLIPEADRPWERGSSPGWVQVMEDEGRYRATLFSPTTYGAEDSAVLRDDPRYPL